MKMTSSEIMQLRNYQIDGKRAIEHAWANGHKNVLYVLATGGGKTVLFSSIAAESTGAVCLIAHRQELVGQMSLALARQGVYHRIVGPKSVVSFIVAMHVEALGTSYYDPSALVGVAGVDTLIRRGDSLKSWLDSVTLWIQDECHHIQKGNKWGKAADMLPNARGLGVTAEPSRADGGGLGRHADGVFDTIVEGPGARELIDAGWLTDYEIVCPAGDLDLSNVALSPQTGDFSRPQLRAAVRRSRIVGDVVDNYQKFAAGRLGITFATDVETATEIALKYAKNGIPAEVVSHKTPDADRVRILRRFRRRDLLQLVNVDLFGEGFDLPAVEVVSMARPTESFGLYCLDPETEVLTRSGWAKWDEKNKLKSIAALDLETNAIRFVRSDSYVCRSLYPNEHIYGIDAPHLSIRVSDSHTMIAKSSGKTSKNWQKQSAIDMSNRKHLFHVPVAGQGDFKGSGLTVSELHFIGWFLSDGTKNKINNSITISQSCAKKTHLEHIKKTLKNCGFRFGEFLVVRKNVPITHNNLAVFTVSKGDARRISERPLKGWNRLEKWLDKSIPKCFDDLTAIELKHILHTLNLGDGVNNHSSLNYNKNTLTITCGDNKKMADRIQALCVVRRLRCNLATQNYEGHGTWHHLLIRDTTHATIAGSNCEDGRIGKKSYKRSHFEKKNDRPDFVWCLENSLGTLITRRNGKVVIVGNCQQFGRSLRPDHDGPTGTRAERLASIASSGKPKALIIDHVGNVERHLLPDTPRPRSLDRRGARGRLRPLDAIPIKVCTQCARPYEAVLRACPYCGFVYVPDVRNAPEFVDGDLELLTPDALDALRRRVAAVDKDPETYRVELAAKHVPLIGQRGHVNRHARRQAMQAALRAAMQWYGHTQAARGRQASEAQRRFYYKFGVDVLTAQALGEREAVALAERVAMELANDPL